MTRWNVLHKMLYVLTAILIALFVYGITRGLSLRELAGWAWSGVRTAKNIAIVMLLVGALTALWRSCGTISYIVDLASGALSPGLFLPAAFLLNSAISVLTGTSIGTAATMGVICMNVGMSLGINPAICGGAILSGAYYGDRCSPVSTSALLVAQVTKTNLYDNIRGMIRTGWIPTVLALAIYGALGFLMNGGSADSGTAEILSSGTAEAFSAKWYLALPAISILVLAIFRVDVKINMLISIAISASLFLCGGDAGNMSMLGHSFVELGKITFLGMLGMMKLILVVLISLTFAGLFRGLGILTRIHQLISKISGRISPFGCTTLTAIFTSAVACNQTLAIVLTNEICEGVMPNEKQRAIAIENTAVIIAPLVPWTVASLVPLGTIGAPTSSILFAFFLILTPVIQIAAGLKSRHLLPG